MDPKYNLPSHSWTMVLSHWSRSLKHQHFIIPWYLLKVYGLDGHPVQAGSYFWDYTRMPGCLISQWMPLIPRFIRTSDEIRNWRRLWDPLFNIYTRDWPSELRDHFGQIDCTDILITYIFFGNFCNLWDNYCFNLRWVFLAWDQLSEKWALGDLRADLYSS